MSEISLTNMTRQTLSALLALRSDYAQGLAKEVDKVLSECDDIRKELQARGDEQDA